MSIYFFKQLKYLYLVLFLFISLNGFSQKINLYLIPGMGTDHKVFNHFNFDTTQVDVVKIKWAKTDTCEGLADYAKVLINQIDTSESFIILGVSMGGMLALEMTNYVDPKALILISSVKSRHELPFKIKAARVFPVHRLLNRRIFTFIANRDRTYKDVQKAEDKILYKKMYWDTGVDFLKWQVDAIVNWQFKKEIMNIPLLHIHGSADHTFPIRKVKADITIDGGTHKMAINISGMLLNYIDPFLLSTMNYSLVPD
jgi:pimeloyl-ACP methyl ester carboxylesterase